MRINDKDLRICLAAYTLTAASLAWGHETGPEFIEAFDTELELHASGRMDIRHVIDLHPHGDEIRRGVFFTRHFAVIGLGIAALVTGIFAPLIYFELFKSPTRAGVTVKRQITGLKRYLENSSPTVRDAQHFMALLPYAIALDAEEAWRKRFECGDESEIESDVAEALAWYREIRRRHESVAAMVP